MTRGIIDVSRFYRGFSTSGVCPYLVSYWTSICYDSLDFAGLSSACITRTFINLYVKYEITLPKSSLHVDSRTSTKSRWDWSSLIERDSIYELLKVRLKKIKITIGIKHWAQPKLNKKVIGIILKLWISRSRSRKI